MLRNSNKPEKNPAAQAPQNERLAPTNIHSKHSPVPGAPGLPALMMPVEQMPPTGQSGVLRHLLSPSASISCLSVGGGPCQPRFTKRFPGVATVLVCAEHMKPSGHIWMRSQLENMQQPHHLNGLKTPPDSQVNSGWGTAATSPPPATTYPLVPIIHARSSAWMGE